MDCNVSMCEERTGSEVSLNITKNFCTSDSLSPSIRILKISVTSVNRNGTNSIYFIVTKFTNAKIEIIFYISNSKPNGMFT